MEIKNSVSLPTELEFDKNIFEAEGYKSDFSISGDNGGKITGTFTIHLP